MNIQFILAMFVVVAAVMVAAGGLISLYKTDQATAFQGILDLYGPNLAPTRFRSSEWGMGVLLEAIADPGGF
ncbi:hypothetical protein [Kyrpidia sp.]|uniref:hypothetical protein n=1 Tax=Kyrpidia sp. TaxID=2073077 RepID=UPI00258C6BF1|nr:hypothetical protein [Kyrpidia sp.]MCL6575247.1 hypothetical protein [Kyrpidia sp.]